MRTFYVQGTKKAAVECIKAGTHVYGIEYKLGDETQEVVNDLKEDAVLKFWTKKDMSHNPVAASYGNWDSKKRKIV